MISREAIANALRFWEPARVLFNVVLLAYGLVRFWEPLLALPHKLWTEIVAVAVLANFIYVIAYPIDLTLQATDYRHRWQTGCAQGVAPVAGAVTPRRPAPAGAAPVNPS